MKTYEKKKKYPHIQKQVRVNIYTWSYICVLQVKQILFSENIVQVTK